MIFTFLQVFIFKYILHDFHCVVKMKDKEKAYLPSSVGHDRLALWIIGKAGEHASRIAGVKGA